MHAFEIFNDKNVRPYGYSDTNFNVSGNSTNPIIETLSETIEK